MEETSHSDDVTKRHQVMCKGDWPEKGYSCVMDSGENRTKSGKESTQCQGDKRGDDVEDKMMTQETSDDAGNVVRFAQARHQKQ